MSHECLQSIPADARRLIVAFSGGLDSSVLLHLVSQHCSDRPIAAWHVNHGLQPAASSMEDFCREQAKTLNLTLRVDRLQLDRTTGNQEARARKARYQLFEQNLESGDCILTAHHQGDQAETFLLNLLRGSGPRGLRGIAARRALGAAQLVRPILHLTRQQIRDYAEQQNLQWFDDPSNAQTDYSRNYLRHEVIPAVLKRWPAAEQKISECCYWQKESQQLLEDLAELDVSGAEIASVWAVALDISALRRFSEIRLRNLLRHWLIHHGYDAPPVGRMQTLIQQLQAENTTTEMKMPGYSLQGYDEKLFLLPVGVETGLAQGYFEFNQAAVITFPGAEKQWTRRQVLEQLGVEEAEQRLSIGFRETVAGKQVSRHRLKNFFQSRRVPPWRRNTLPLVFVNQQLTGYLL